MTPSGRNRSTRSSTAAASMISSAPARPGPPHASTMSPRARSARTRCVPTKPSAPVTRTFTSSPPAQPLEVGVHHHLHELAEIDRRRPSELGLGLGRIPDQVIDLRRADELRVHDHVLLPVEVRPGESDLTEIPDAVSLVGGDYVVGRFGLLHHHPH